MAQKNATPTAEQSRVLADNCLRPEAWTVVKDLQYSMIIRNRVTGEFRVINK